MSFLSRSDRDVDARIVNQILIASFRDSTPPMFWQFDLVKNHSFSLSVREAGTDWELGVAVEKGAFSPICRFTSSAEAERAYYVITSVMMSRKSTGHRRWWGCLLGLLVALALVFLIVVLAGSGGVKVPHQPQLSGNVPSMNAPEHSGGPMEIRNGVPMTADDVLRPPPE